MPRINRSLRNLQWILRRQAAAARKSGQQAPTRGRGPESKDTFVRVRSRLDLRRLRALQQREQGRPGTVKAGALALQDNRRSRQAPRAAQLPLSGSRSSASPVANPVLADNSQSRGTTNTALVGAGDANIPRGTASEKETTPAANGPREGFSEGFDIHISRIPLPPEERAAEEAARQAEAKRREAEDLEKSGFTKGGLNRFPPDKASTGAPGSATQVAKPGVDAAQERVSGPVTGDTTRGRAGGDVDNSPDRQPDPTRGAGANPAANGPREGFSKEFDKHISRIPLTPEERAAEEAARQAEAKRREAEDLEKSGFTKGGLHRFPPDKASTGAPGSATQVANPGVGAAQARLNIQARIAERMAGRTSNVPTTARETAGSLPRSSDVQVTRRGPQSTTFVGLGQRANVVRTAATPRPAATTAAPINRRSAAPSTESVRNILREQLRRNAAAILIQESELQK